MQASPSYQGPVQLSAAEIASLSALASRYVDWKPEDVLRLYESQST